MDVPENAAVRKDQHGEADLEVDQELVLEMLEVAAYTVEPLVGEPDA